MATTARNLITGAMRLLNIVQSGEVPSPDDMSIAISAFDAMIDSWSNDRLMIYSINPYVFNLNAGQKDYLMGPGNNILTYGAIVPGTAYVNGTYTNVAMIGGTGTGAFATIIVAGGLVISVQVFDNSTQLGITPGFGYKAGDLLTAANLNLGGTGSGFSVLVTSVSPGDWNLIRPMRIEQAYIMWNMAPQTVDIPVSLSTDSEFAAITVKSVQSSIPLTLYDNGNWPLKTITMWPVPSVSSQMRLWLRQPLIDLTNLDDMIQFPPGYERAFRFNLAVELAPEFAKTTPPEVAGIALNSRLEIARLNADPQYQVGDGGTNASSSQVINYITGGFLGW